MNQTIYLFDGKPYRTVNGLCNAIAQKHGADEVGCVTAERTLNVFRNRGVIATYSVSAPALGMPMRLTCLSQASI